MARLEHYLILKHLPPPSLFPHIASRDCSFHNAVLASLNLDWSMLWVVSQFPPIDETSRPSRAAVSRLRQVLLQIHTRLVVLASGSLYSLSILSKHQYEGRRAESLSTYHQTDVKSHHRTDILGRRCWLTQFRTLRAGLALDLVRKDTGRPRPLARIYPQLWVSIRYRSTRTLLSAPGGRLLPSR